SQVLARQQADAVMWEHRDPLTGSAVASYLGGGISPVNQLDPMGVNVGFDDPFTPCCDPPPAGDTGTPSLLAGFEIPSGRCTLDGVAITCSWASQSVLKRAILSITSVVELPTVLIARAQLTTRGITFRQAAIVIGLVATALLRLTINRQIETSTGVMTRMGTCSRATKNRLTIILIIPPAGLSMRLGAM